MANSLDDTLILSVLKYKTVTSMNIDYEYCEKCDKVMVCKIKCGLEMNVYFCCLTHTSII